MAVNWLLGTQQGPDPGQRFQMGFEHAQQRQQQQQDRQLRLQSHMREQYATALDLEARDMGSVTDQASLDAAYQRSVQRASQLGLPQPQHPGQYSPELVNRIRMQALTVKDQMTLEQREDRRTPLQQNYEWLQETDPDAAAAYLRRQTEPLPRYVTRPDGSVQMILPPADGDDEWDYSPPGQGGAGQPGPQTFP